MKSERQGWILRPYRMWWPERSTPTERQGWDSNPRCLFEHAGFQDQYLKPLGHLAFFWLFCIIKCGKRGSNPHSKKELDSKSSASTQFRHPRKKSLDRDSNPESSAYKAGALAVMLSRQKVLLSMLLPEQNTTNSK